MKNQQNLSFLQVFCLQDPEIEAMLGLCWAMLAQSWSQNLRKIVQNLFLERLFGKSRFVFLFSAECLSLNRYVSTILSIFFCGSSGSSQILYALFSNQFKIPYFEFGGLFDLKFEYLKSVTLLSLDFESQLSLSHSLLSDRSIGFLVQFY